jgi:hypothetical protein
MHDILLGILFLCMVLFPAAIAMRSSSEREQTLKAGVDDSDGAHDFVG